MNKKLGASGLEVSAVGLGCMENTHASGTAMSVNDGVNIIR